MNEKAHWNKIADSYEDEIFDVFKSDKSGRLLHYFDKHALPGGDAIDFGCGVGKAFPYLSPRFKNVLATDISDACLSIAKNREFTNVTFRQADLTKPGLQFPKADFGFCCNVVMLPTPAQNESMLKNIRRSLKPGASAIVIVPSLESILYSSWVMTEWYRKEGVSAKQIPESEFDYYKGGKKDIVTGLIRIDGVPTKHYSEPEIKVFFGNAGLTVTAVEKLEYSWQTEFDEPPKWMGAPFPWDWLVECTSD